MKVKSLFSMLLVVILLSSVFTGCSGGKGSEANQSFTERNELVLALGQEPEGGFDPTTGWGRYGSPLFQSTLLKRDSELNIVNDLAENYSISSDGLVWTVELKKGVKFSDGTELTAADVVYTYDTALKSGSVIDLNIMKSIRAKNDYIVVFELEKAQSTFVNSLIALGIVPKHLHGKGYAENPIGSGPFKLVQWDKGQQLIVEANPEYYGAKPYFKKLTFLFLSQDATFSAARAGEVDVSAIPAAFAKQGVPGMRINSVESVDNRGIMFPFIQSGNKTKDGIPIGNDVTADISIRKAINMAIDRKALVDGVLEGFGTPAYSVCDGLPWWNPETVIKDGDMEAAKKLLEDAGWRDLDEDGIREKGGLRAQFNLLYASGDQSRQSLAIAASDMLRPLGIDIRVEGKSWDDIERLMHSNAVLFGWGSHDPLEMYNLYSSKTAGVEWFNTGFYGNTSVDDHMEKALEARSEEEALAYWKKAQWDGNTGLSAKGDAPWAWLVNLKHVYLVKEGLDMGKHKIQPHGHGWPITDNIEEWKWNK